MDIIAGATIDGAGLQRFAPHLVVRHTMCADKADSVELARKLTDIVHIGEIEIEDDGVCAATTDNVLYLVNVSRDAYVLEVGVQFCCKMFGHDAIRLGHNHFVWVHDSLSFTAPQPGATNAAIRLTKSARLQSLAMGRPVQEPSARNP